MPTTLDRDVQELAATLPSCWNDKNKLEIAEAALLANTVHEVNAAYDSAFGNMLRGEYHNGRNETHQDPMLSKYAPNGRNGRNSIIRNGRSDEAVRPNAEELLNFIQI
jgi:hypothetical protein